MLYVVVPTVSQVLCRIWASKRFTNSAAEKLQELHMASGLQVIVFDCESENRFGSCIGLSHCHLSSLHLPVSGQS